MTVGLQHYLVNSGRRVCTYDNLGYGWSSDLLARAEDQALYLDNLITATKETLPMIFVAWGKETVKSLSRNNPTHHIDVNI